MNGKHYLFEDPKFRRNVEGLAKAGIPFGVYHFLTASDSAECRAEAEFFLKTVASYRDKITLYLACDAENSRKPVARKAVARRAQPAHFGVLLDRSEGGVRGLSLHEHRSHPEFRRFRQNSVPGLAGALRKISLEADRRGRQTGDSPVHIIRQPQLHAGRFDLDFGYAPLAKLIVRERCGSRSRHSGSSPDERTATTFLCNLPINRRTDAQADPRPVDKAARPLIRLHCGLKNDDISYLLGYRYADDLFRKLYTAMLVN